MSVIARKFSAAPVRTAADTWKAIMSAVTDTGKSTYGLLAEIEGIVSSIIAEGTPQNDPITFIGKGPRLRVYCLYEDDGSTEDANEKKIDWDLFGDDSWTVHIPVEEHDFDWVKKSLEKKGKHFKAYKQGSAVSILDEKEGNTKLENNLTINLSKL